uniref:Uncharacterized protein n=2 Tax=Kalanchoe fedtschenkoi TaxID=63787 RepID=A0A7N0TLN8_KALFE
MPRYDDRYSATRLYVGHLSSRTRTRDLESIFGRYGRVRDVDMKRDFAFVDFSDHRDADDARYRLDGRELDGSRIIVEFARGAPRGPGGSREYLGRGPPPGSGRCFNCGLDGHWARDCKAGDWKNKCYRCGERGHTEKNCKNSPKKLRRDRSYSRSPSPRRGRSRSRSFSRGRSYSRSRTPPKRNRGRDLDRHVSRSPRYSRSPKRERQSPSPRVRDRSQTPDERSPRYDRELANGSDYSGSPKAISKGHGNDAGDRSGSPVDGQVDIPSPVQDDDRSPIDDNKGHNGSPVDSD